MARPFAEQLLLRIAYAYEQGTHHRQPPSSMLAPVPRATARQPPEARNWRTAGAHCASAPQCVTNEQRRGDIRFAAAFFQKPRGDYMREICVPD
jgi:hypothetical protein